MTKILAKAMLSPISMPPGGLGRSRSDIFSGKVGTGSPDPTKIKEKDFAFHEKLLFAPFA
jgi:hypothetical protein